MDSPSIDHQGPPKKPSIEQKILDNNDDEEHAGVDFISNLPDAILSHIISKLPTKYAVGTAILSTRWKDLFSEIPYPSLDFDDSLILHPSLDSLILHPVEGAKLLDSYSEERITCFVNFMYRVMDVILKDVPFISTFRLKCEDEYEDYQIVDWVCAALSRHVIRLELIFGIEDPTLLFDSLSGCTTLNYLELNESIIHAHASFSLPNLKNLLIKHTCCVCEYSLPRLLSGCPVLEHLTLSHTSFGESESVNISIPSLKFLIIEYCYNTETAYKLVLDTPELDLLFYQDNVTKGYTVKNLSTLLKARIEFGNSDHLWEDDISQYDQNVADLVTGCSSVDSLSISKTSLMFFYDSGRPLPMFRNLKHLQLGGFDTNGWELLAEILESAPKLEHLDITEGFYEEKGCYARFAASLPVNVPVCLSSHLKQIEIWAFKGEEDEFKLVEYLLRTAKVLNKIEICCDMSLDTYICTKKKLFSLKSISKMCELWLSKISSIRKH